MAWIASESRTKRGLATDLPNETSHRIAQRISCTLHRENARAILRRSLGSVNGSSGLPGDQVPASGGFLCGCLFDCLVCCPGVSLHRLLFVSLRGSSLSWYFRACACACVCASASCWLHVRPSSLAPWEFWRCLSGSFWIFQNPGRLFH